MKLSKQFLKPLTLAVTGIIGVSIALIACSTTPTSKATAKPTDEGKRSLSQALI